MPFYEYKCLDCEKDFEFFARKMSEEAGCCPECGSKTIKRLISLFGFKSGSTQEGNFRSSSGSACSSCASSSCSTCKP